MCSQYLLHVLNFQTAKPRNERNSQSILQVSEAEMSYKQ
jgi:hypothetical protein